MSVRSLFPWARPRPDIQPVSEPDLTARWRGGSWHEWCVFLRSVNDPTELGRAYITLTVKINAMQQEIDELRGKMSGENATHPKG